MCKLVELLEMVETKVSEIKHNKKDDRLAYEYKQILYDSGLYESIQSMFRAINESAQCKKCNEHNVCKKL